MCPKHSMTRLWLASWFPKVTGAFPGIGTSFPLRKCVSEPGWCSQAGVASQCKASGVDNPHFGIVAHSLVRRRAAPGRVSAETVGAGTHGLGGLGRTQCSDSSEALAERTDSVEKSRSANGSCLCAVLSRLQTTDPKPGHWCCCCWCHCCDSAGHLSAA